MKLAVVPESLQQSTDFLNMHSINVVFQKTLPEIHSKERSLVRLVIRIQCAKGNSRAHVLARGQLVVLFKLLIDKWVVDVSERHVVENVGHVLEWKSIVLIVM